MLKFAQSKNNAPYFKSFKGKAKIYYLYLKCMNGLLLSHHPFCDNFDSHTIKIGKHRLCIGCFIGYPTAIIAIILIPFLVSLHILEIRLFLYLSITLLSFFILSPLNLTKMKSIKIMQKLLIGWGSAFLFWYIWSLPNSFIINMITFFWIFGILLGVLNAYHALGLFKICKKCQYSSDWEFCPGFSKIVECFQKYQLKNVFINPTRHKKKEINK